MKQLSVKTLICIHNASGDTVGKGVFFTLVYTCQDKNLMLKLLCTLKTLSKNNPYSLQFYYPLINHPANQLSHQYVKTIKMITDAGS